ncbi:hypothetical protein EDB83DRAFT_2524842 [Lactarius deliciosus]|nr:hypothetical protein EDB83DRAFT_2524842 [Lactarius deliciosus]
MPTYFVTPDHRVRIKLRSALPTPVYNTLFASTNGELPVLRISRPDIEKWLKERMITSAFLERFVNIIFKAGQSDTAYHYKLTHVSLLDPVEIERR